MDKKNGAVIFRNQVLKGLHEVISGDKKKYQYAKSEGSVVITFTDEYLATIEDGKYDLLIINGDEYWPMIVKVKNHKLVGLEDQKIDNSKDLTQEQMKQLLQKYADKGIKVTEASHAGYSAGQRAVSGMVLFDANGGSGTMKPKEYTIGENITLPKNTFTRTGYSFVGWNTEADGSGATYEDKTMFVLIQDMVLYAQWQKDQAALTLKDVAATEKKLTASAALTINGETVKGKKVTFTVEGKTYTVKTNKNGVAKLTVKNLKLTSGDKVTIKAQYDDQTARKTVKVK